MQTRLLKLLHPPWKRVLYTGDDTEPCQVRSCGKVRKQEGTFVDVNDVDNYFNNYTEIPLPSLFAGLVSRTDWKCCKNFGRRKALNCSAARNASAFWSS